MEELWRKNEPTNQPTTAEINGEERNAGSRAREREGDGKKKCVREKN